MATLFTLDFTAADTTLWTDPAVGFEKVFGTTSVTTAIARVASNAGIQGSTANESIYRSVLADALRDYKFRMTMTWDNAAGAAREMGPGVRISSDGETGYFALVNSNLGAGEMRLVRRNGGVMTDLAGGPVSISEGPSNLNAGVVVELRHQNVATGVRLTAKIGTHTYFDYTDPYVAGTSIDDGGNAGIYVDALCVTDDIVVDTAEARDFQDEATSGTGWQTGIGLVINGVYYSESEWQAAGLDPVSVRSSYVVGPVATINDLNDAGSPFLHPGDWVKILKNNTPMVEGVIQQAKHQFASPEGSSYDLVGPRQLADDVLIENPTTGEPFVSFNLDPDSELYDEDFDDFTLGDMLGWIEDNLLLGDYGLRALKAAPASGAAYVGRAALDFKAPNVTLSGTVLQAEEAILALMMDYAIYMDPDTRERVIRKRSTASIINLKTSEHHLDINVARDVTNCYTRAVIFGTRPDAQETSFLFDKTDLPGSTAQPYWPYGLNGTWTPEKAKTGTSESEVVGAGFESALDPNNPLFCYVDLDTAGTFSMTAEEWAGTLMTFVDGPLAGQTLTVRNNSTSRVWFTVLAWPGGTPPSVGNTGVLSGVDDPNMKRNGYDAAFREFDLGSGAAVKAACMTAIVKNRKDGVTQSQVVKVKKFDIIQPDGSVHQGMRLDFPAVGLINNLSTLCDTPGGAEPADSVEFTAPTYDDTVKYIPKITVPTSGWRGTAYSYDTAKWNGGGEPGIGDPARKHTLALSFPDFQSVALQGAEYIKMADSILAVLGTVAVSGTVVLNDDEIDLTFLDLDFRLTLEDDGDAGTTPRASGFEASDDIWPLEVVYDLRNETTTITVGTLSARGVDLDGQRKRYAERTRYDNLRKFRQLAEELRNCLSGAFNGAGAVGDSGAGVTAGCNVTSDVPGVSMLDRVGNISIDIDTWIDDVLDALGSVFEFNKGFTFARDDDNKITVFDAAGAAIGSVSPGGGYTPTGVVPRIGGVEAGILANLGKTVDADGNVLTPGTAVPPGGARYYPPGGGAPTLLGGGTTVPPSLHTQIESLKQLTTGMVPTNAANTGPGTHVIVPTAHGGSVYAPNTNFGFTKVSGPGLAGPSVGGAVGNVLGKCGTTLDGAADPGSGPGALVPPGSTVDTDGAYYYPPTQALGQPDVEQLSSGDEAPGSTVDILFAAAKIIGLAPHDLGDRGGAVFTDGTLFYRLENSTGDFREVEAVTAGTGVNDGDWDWASPTVYYAGIDHGGLAGLADDDHPQYQKESEKNAASGYVGLNAAGAAVGGFAYEYLSKIATYGVALGDRGKIILVNTAGGSVTMNLLAVATAGIGYVVGFKKVTSDANTVTMDGNSSETIDGALTFVITDDQQVVWLFCDGTNWHVIAEGRVPAGGSAAPVGSILAYGAAAAPVGYLLCDGAAVSRTTYATLFALVSTTFGSGDGSTTFNVPDLRDRFPQGESGGSGLGNTLGGVGGSKTPTYTDAGHTHALNSAPKGTGAPTAATPTGAATLSGTASISTTDGRPPFLNVGYIIKY